MLVVETNLKRDVYISLYAMRPIPGVSSLVAAPEMFFPESYLLHSLMWKL